MEAFEFRDQRRRIDHHARADHCLLVGPQNPAGNELENETVAIEDHGVAGVVAAAAARDVVEGARQVVNHLAFAFVTPLGAHHDDRFHQPDPAPALDRTLPCRSTTKGNIGKDSQEWRKSYPTFRPKRRQARDAGCTAGAVLAATRLSGWSSGRGWQGEVRRAHSPLS